MRQKLEAAAAAAPPAPHAQGRQDYIADRVKQRRYSSVVNFATQQRILLKDLAEQYILFCAVHDSK